mgnify:CR=1 FL=1
MSLRNAEGNELAVMELKQSYPSLVIAVPGLALGEAYAIHAGEGKAVGVPDDGHFVGWEARRPTWLTGAGVTTAPRTFPGWRR